MALKILITLLGTATAVGLYLAKIRYDRRRWNKTPKDHW